MPKRVCPSILICPQSHNAVITELSFLSINGICRRDLTQRIMPDA